jgi:hypothetical protein
VQDLTKSGSVYKDDEIMSPTGSEIVEVHVGNASAEEERPEIAFGRASADVPEIAFG